MDQFELKYCRKELAGHETCVFFLNFVSINPLWEGDLHLGDAVKDIWTALTAKTLASTWHFDLADVVLKQLLF